MRFLFSLLSLALMALTSACTSLEIKERNFIRPDSISGKPAPTSPQIAVQVASSQHTLTEVSINVAPDVSLRGIVMRRPDALATVLYFGGNGFHLDIHGTELLKLLAACPVNVVSFDYRGYGRSNGVPTVQALADDTLKLFDQANTWFPGEVVVHGQSLGSFMAAFAAGQRPVKAAILEATAPNASEWADANLPWFARPFVTLNISAPLREVDNSKALANYTGPLLVLTGSADTVTPQRLGKSVFNASKSTQKELVLVDQAGHENMLDFPEGVAAYCGFLKRL